ncbi:MAG TPA: anti-sigma factor [Streptosporangiaceae bacterium]|nr:anti-sigma factor [Streptosporangiaceae bacterium]
MRDDLHVLTGSYVLDAISDAEREEFERHLQHCPTCETEVRGLRETAARLALACAVTPPARMERRVLAAAYQTRQLPPLSADRPRRARPRRRALPRLALPRRLAVLAAAASMAAAVALGITQLSAQHQLDQARATAIARVVTAPDAHVETARTSAGGNVTVVTSAALREAVVSASGMASLPSSRVYQVWVLSPSGARSAGLMHGSSVLAAVRPGDRIGITVEPAGGTARPTTTPVAVLPV